MNERELRMTVERESAVVELTDDVLDLLDALDPSDDPLYQELGEVAVAGILLKSEEVDDAHVRVEVSSATVEKSSSMMSALTQAVAGFPALFAHGSAFCAHCVSSLSGITSAGASSMGGGLGSALAGGVGHFHADGSWHVEGHDTVQKDGHSPQTSDFSFSHGGGEADGSAAWSGYDWFPKWRPNFGASEVSRVPVNDLFVHFLQ